VPVPTGPPPSKLVVIDLKKGNGPAAGRGDELSVRYFRLAYRGHRIYEDSWGEPPPPFVLGKGQRAEGWEDGLLGISAGGRRELIEPGGQVTLGDADIYVVEALSVEQGKGPAPPRASTATIKVKGRGPKPKLHYPPEPPKHVVVRVLREGSGPRLRSGDALAARYVGGNPKSGFVQDFWSEGAPYRFQLGENNLGKAWEIGLGGMRLGGRRELIVPSRLAYGEGMMVYVIEPLEMETRKPRRQG